MSHSGKEDKRDLKNIWEHKRKPQNLILIHKWKKQLQICFQL